MRITYLFDPLCGWCYGAGPALEWLAAVDDVTLELSPTGLFAGESARRMDKVFASYAWQNDQRIARLTGQPFTEAYRSQVLGAEGTMFDSAPATLALVAVGLTEPGDELAALKAIQRARYEDGLNNSDLATVAGILANAGLSAAAERISAPDDELLAAYRERISAARADMARFGVGGVPALVIGEGAGRRLLRGNALFGPFDHLTAELAA